MLKRTGSGGSARGRPRSVGFAPLSPPLAFTFKKNANSESRAENSNSTEMDNLQDGDLGAKSDVALDLNCEKNANSGSRAENPNATEMDNLKNSNLDTIAEIADSVKSLRVENTENAKSAENAIEKNEQMNV